MPKRSRTAKKLSVKLRTQKRPPADPNLAAASVLRSVIESGEAEGKNPLAVALGRLGGLKGGRARAERLSRDELRESARKAAKARWDKG